MSARHEVGGADDAHSHDCARALQNLQAFLHRELSEADADEIRQHLAACESCLDEFDIENAITGLIRRAHRPVQASSALRLRISQVSVTWREMPRDDV